MQELTTGQTIQWERFQLTLHRALPQAMTPSMPNVILLDDDTLPDKLLIRRRKPGDRYIPVGHRHPEKLKRLMWEHNVPVSERSRWPLIVSVMDDGIIWSPRLPVAAPFAPTAHTKRFAIITWKPD
jgi:tRNA(Ile)-lysidine synthase